MGLAFADNVVVIPTCNRPEMLALCLRRLDAAPGCPEVHIYADTAAKLDEVEYVRDAYLPNASIFHAKAHQPGLSGCWNILNSIKEGARWAKDVFLIEEDVMVYPWYFQWHNAQTAAASCGRKPPRPYELYTNPGSCLRRPLLDALVPHINDSYFADTAAYCEANFRSQAVSTLDDGLIRRVLTDNGMDWVYPERPTCAHQGFHMYGRTEEYRTTGTLPERIEQLEKMLERVEVGSRYTLDFEKFEIT